MGLKSFFYRENRNVEGYKNKRPGKDAGYDLYAVESKWILPFQTVKVETNAHIHIPKGVFGRIIGRSGMSLKGWLVYPGTIDHGYSGNLGVIMGNISLLPRRIKQGDRIAQIIFIPFVEVDLSEEVLQSIVFENRVLEDSQSDRNTTGFGDSGTN